MQVMRSFGSKLALENIVSIIRTVFIIIVVSLFLLIWWTFYTEGDLGFGGTIPTREDRPLMEEVTLLLDDVTKGLPPVERNTERSSLVVRSAVKVYRNPTQEVVNRLIQNINNQQIWKEVHFEDYREFEYCYNQYHLIINHEINDYTAIGKSISNLMFVHVSWTDDSPCRKAYLERLNSNPPKL